MFLIYKKTPCRTAHQTVRVLCLESLILPQDLLVILANFSLQSLYHGLLGLPDLANREIDKDLGSYPQNLKYIRNCHLQQFSD